MVELLLISTPRLIALAVLLAVSAFFSGSETAFFSLSRDRLRRFRMSGKGTERLAAHLVDNPRSLLVTLLFGNMIVNVTYFALSGEIIWKAAVRFGSLGGLAASTIMLLAVIILGEVTPKTIAATAPVGLARLATLPLYLLRGLLTPIIWLLDHLLVEPLTRLVTGRRGDVTGDDIFVTTDELQAIVDLAREEGTVSRDESDMINEVLELHEVRLPEIMVPRVDMIACSIDTPTAELLELFRHHLVKRIVIYRGQIDDVVGLANARTAFLHPERPVSQIVEPVLFVPEQQTVEALLKQFRRQKAQFAIVVDEFGGTAGLVTLEDCVEEIVGELREEHEPHEEPVKRLDQRRFELAGDLSIRGWHDYLPTALAADMDVTTLGGFVTRLLGRIPKAGDTCMYGNLRFTVLEVSVRPYGPFGRPVRVLVEVLDGPPPQQGGGGKP